MEAHNIHAPNSTFNIVGGDQYNSYSPDERWTIATWLSDLNFEEKQNDIFAERADGTGEWLLESQTFKAWVEGDSEALWCPGIPGAGKTILASIVVDYLKTTFQGDDVAIACIYCDYQEQTKQTVTELMASLLRQLVQPGDLSAPSDNIKKFYRYHHDHRKARPRLPALMEAFESELKRFSKAFIVVDALDECLERNQDDLITRLRSLVGVNLMVTSRALPSIVQLFQDAKRLDISAATNDVQKYIRSRIPYERRLARHTEMDRTLEDSIVSKIVTKAGGMFLLAKLHMDSLVGKSSSREVRNALERLPAEVTASYDDAMERIRGQVEYDRELAERVLLWVTCARRPLLLEELQHALAVTHEMTEMDSDVPVDDHILTYVCTGLVVVDERSNIIRLVHYTAQEYFNSNRESFFPNAEATIAMTCLTYLSFDLFRNFDPWELGFLEEIPLFAYAASHWGYHAYGKAEETVNEMVLKFVSKLRNVACTSYLLLLNQRDPKYRECAKFPTTFTGMHLLSFFGLERSVRHQLENGARANLQIAYGWTPLLLAADQGHEAVVQLLMARNDVEINQQDEYHGRTALLFAAEMGHEGVIRLLLERDDVDVNLKDKYAKTPLSLAAQNGHEGVVKLLLARADVDVNLEVTYDHRTPLSYSAENGHKAITRLLLSRDDVELNQKDEHHGRTELMFAAAKGHETVIKLLLERDDVDVNSEDRYGKTPLSLAVQNGHEGVVKLLLARGDVNVNSRDQDGHTVLLFAAKTWDETTVRQLVAREDVDVNSRDQDGQTALLFAAKYGHEAVARLLVAVNDIDVNSKDIYDRSALWFAAKNGHESVVRLLLARKEVEVNSEDLHESMTPLRCAVKHGHSRVIKLLIAQKEVIVDSQGTDNHSLLWLAAKHGNDTVVGLLASRSDDELNLKNSCGRSPLSCAAAKGHEALVRLLVARAKVEVHLRHDIVAYLLTS